jgi:hypothetical protein
MMALAVREIVKQCIGVSHSSMTAVIRVFATDDNNLLVVQFLCYFEIVITINVMCLSIMVRVTEEFNELYALHFEGEEVIMVKP